MKPTRFLFVGVGRSQKAIDMDVTWLDGRLAAKQLFDALRAIGVNPHAQRYVNWDEQGSLPIINRAHRRPSDGWIIVGMGRYVQQHLSAWRITHVRLVHPAARGTIRRKENYLEHVRRTLTEAVERRGREAAAVKVFLDRPARRRTLHPVTARARGVMPQRTGEGDPR